MKVHSDGDEKPHICTLCNKIMSTQSELNDHLKQHSNPKPYKCDVSLS